jgi:hypothetical protein
VMLRHILLTRALAVGSGSRNVVVGRRRLDGPDSGDEFVTMAKCRL